MGLARIITSSSSHVFGNSRYGLVSDGLGNPQNVFGVNCEALVEVLPNQHSLHLTLEAPPAGHTQLNLEVNLSDTDDVGERVSDYGISCLCPGDIELLDSLQCKVNSIETRLSKGYRPLCRFQCQFRHI